MLPIKKEQKSGIANSNSSHQEISNNKLINDCGSFNYIEIVVYYIFTACPSSSKHRSARRNFEQIASSTLLSRKSLVLVSILHSEQNTIESFAFGSMCFFRH